MKLALLLALLTVGECGSSTVDGRIGQNITLPCKYDISSHKLRPVCWSRGTIPNSGCGEQLISTDGLKVTSSRASSRYQLLGRLDEGDVSLTILNITGSDSGRYGCRVDIWGWFNDDKHHFDLNVNEAAQTTSSTTLIRDTSTEQATVSHAAGHVTSTETLLTSSSSSLQAEESSSATVVLVCLLFGLVALVTAGGLFVIARRWRQLNKNPQQQFNSTVQFSSTSSTLQLHRQSSAVENIYQIDGGEYEYCP